MSQALFVAWRASDYSIRGWSPVGKLDFHEGLYRFVYTQGARTLAHFHAFPGMPELEAIYTSEELFPIFANRLLSRSRPEYEAYLCWGGFDPHHPPDPLSILGVTEGIRQTDFVEVFPCPAPDANGCYLAKFFLHGLRWVPQAALARIDRLRTRDRLALMIDLSNPYDASAVAVRTTDDRDRFLVGYVPRYLARDLRTLAAHCDPEFLDLRVERLNPSAPLQMRVLCRMNACWPPDFHPCAGEEFQPIPAMSDLAEESTRA